MKHSDNPKTSQDKSTVYSSSLYQPLNPSETKKVVQSAFRVLERGGVRVFSKTALEAFKTAGADLDRGSQIVKLPQGLVEDSIATNPSSITLYSRDGSCDCVLQKNRVHYGTGGTAIYVLDPDTGERRPSNVSDVILNAQLVQKLANIHIFTINVFPNELKDPELIDINRFFHAFDNTTKHVMGGVYTLDGCKNVVKIAQEIAGGEEALRQEPFVSFIALIISPFKIDDLYGEITCYLAREGLPVVVPAEPICGTTAPVTLAGNVLTHVIETLAGITLVQAIRKGAPGICGSVGSITNLHTLDHVGGSIERAMLNAAVSQVIQEVDLPLYSTGGTTDAKSVESQAGIESGMSNLLVAMSGANYIHDAAGLMEADLTVSYEKLVLDDEILGMCQRVLRGIEVTDETLAADLMIEKGPGSDYLMDDHTIRHMRSEFFMPRLANRKKREDFCQDDDALGRAKAFVKGQRMAQTASYLPNDLRERLLRMFPGIRQPEVRGDGNEAA